MNRDFSKTKNLVLRQLVAHLKRCKKGYRFTLPNLISKVMVKHPDIVPDSVGRGLRELRQLGVIGYKVLDRATSYYELTKAPAIKLERLAKKTA